MAVTLPPLSPDKLHIGQRYSTYWARNIVKKLISAYPRATSIVLHNLDKTQENLAEFLAYADPRWYQIRNLIHLVEKLMTQRGFMNDGRLWKYCAKYLEGNGYKDLLLDLDNHRKRYKNNSCRVTAGEALRREGAS